MAVPSLNWKEIEALAETLESRLKGAWIDRVIVPERAFAAAKFLKGEMYFRLSGPGAPEGLVLNLRVREPYLYIVEKQGLKAATVASKSAFIQVLAKYLSGAKCLSVESVLRERILVLWLEPGGGVRMPSGVGNERLGLFLNFMPSRPEAILVSDREGRGERRVQNGDRFQILASSRSAEPDEVFTIPDGKGAPDAPGFRYVWSEDAVTEALKNEGKLSAVQKARAAWQERQTHALKAKKQALVSLKTGEAEPDWQVFGEIVKAHLSELGSLKRREKFVTLENFSTGQTEKIPWNPKNSPQEIAKEFFTKAKQKVTRIYEARGRLEVAERILAEPAPGEEIGGAHGTAQSSPSKTAAKYSQSSSKNGPKNWPKNWNGKVFLSTDGLPILVGRNNKENLELTTKIARGNDLWLHLRGRPSAHAIVVLPKGKSASLETLLDAATLIIHYSGGTAWGKTEVDYTFRKNVKRIKDSTKVSYTHNKTIAVLIDKKRLDRLLTESLEGE